MAGAVQGSEDQLARWLELISEYDLEIKHRQGRSHGNADGLSRRPCKQCGRDDEVPAEQIRALAEEASEDPSIATLQEQDEDIQPVRAAMMKAERPTDEVAASLSERARRLLDHWDMLEMSDSILLQRWESADGATRRKQIILPRKLLKDVIR